MKTMKIMKTMRILVLSSLVLMFACKPDLRVPEGYDEYGNRLVRRVTEIYSGVCHPIDFYYDEQGRIVTVTDSYTHSNWGFLAWNEYAFERSGGNLEIKGHWKAKVSDGWHWKAKGYSFLQKIPIGSFLGGLIVARVGADWAIVLEGVAQILTAGYYFVIEKKK